MKCLIHAFSKEELARPAASIGNDNCSGYRSHACTAHLWKILLRKEVSLEQHPENTEFTPEDHCELLLCLN